MAALTSKTPDSETPHRNNGRKVPSRRWAASLVALALLGGLSGCVSRAQHSAQLGESEMKLSRTHDLVGRQLGGAYLSIEELKKQRANLATEISAREKALAALHDKALAWKNRSDHAEAKSTELKTDMFKLGENVDRLRIKTAQLEKELEAAKAAKAAVDAQLTDNTAALASHAAEREAWEKRRAAERRSVDALKAKLHQVLKSGNVSVAMRKGRLIVQLSNAVLFESGKTHVSDEGKTALTAIGNVLKDLRQQRIEIGGHTDNASIKTERYPSNWELSTARATSVLHVLREAGVDPAVLSAAGYGQHDPIANNETREGRSENRRIEIALVPNVGELLNLVEEADDEPGDNHANEHADDQAGNHDEETVDDAADDGE